jgi:hypothetical protein
MARIIQLGPLGNFIFIFLKKRVIYQGKECDKLTTHLIPGAVAMPE